MALILDFNVDFKKPKLNVSFQLIRYDVWLLDVWWFEEIEVDIL